ncbi:MAG: hypothetical protein LH479_13610 [Polaromonas sp.]|nr:hypothetical protein [Polaromonas sp.]
MRQPFGVTARLLQAFEYQIQRGFLLALAEYGQADVRVSGDQLGVSARKSHVPCRIVAVRQFVGDLGLGR